MCWGRRWGLRIRESRTFDGAGRLLLGMGRLRGVGMGARRRVTRFSMMGLLLLGLLLGDLVMRMRGRVVKRRRLKVIRSGVKGEEK